MGLIQRFIKAPAHAGILVMHGAVESFVDEDVQLNHLHIAELERFVAGLLKSFDVVSLSEIVDALSRGDSPPRRAMALTFDDGYSNNLTVVDPLLRAYNLPYTVFVTTRFVDEEARLPTYVMRAALKRTSASAFSVPKTGDILPLQTDDDRAAAIAFLRGHMKALRQDDVSVLVSALQTLLSEEEWAETDGQFSSEAPLSWSDLRVMAARGVTIGSHCHDHAILHAAQSAQVVKEQLEHSKEVLERELSQPCEHFAYPNGTRRDVSADAVRLVAEAGYASGLTNIAGTICRTDDRFFLPRLYVTRDVGRTLGGVRHLDRRDSEFARAYAEVVGA